MSWHRFSIALAVVTFSFLGAACSPDAINLGGPGDQTKEPSVVKSDEASTHKGAAVSGDIGSVGYVEVKATGVGPTATAAVDDALYSAIRQANGASISGGSVQYSSATYVRSTFGDIDIASSGFAQALVAQSRGSVTAFAIDAGSPQKLTATSGQVGDRWSASITATIAKYMRPDAANRPALVIAQPRLSRAAVNAGTFSPDVFLSSLKQATEDSVTGTNRFAVINRELTSEALAELDIAESGLSPVEQGARIGHLLAAEVVVIPTVQLAQYEKSVRELRTSDRDLVSYKAALVIRFDVINATTGQTIFSSTYERAPKTPQATTLGATVAPQRELELLLTEIASSFVADLNRRTFPVSVIAFDGDIIVLSQGGMSVTEGASYQAVRKGNEYFDPQTGQSLGRQEIPVGTIVVDKADVNLSYGTLNATSAYDLASFSPGDIELRDRVDVVPVAGERKSTQIQTVPVTPKVDRSAPSESTSPEVVSVSEPEEDPDW